MDFMNFADRTKACQKKLKLLPIKEKFKSNRIDFIIFRRNLNFVNLIPFISKESQGFLINDKWVTLAVRFSTN